ncbi:membrane protein [Asaia sp. SF2.1]|nr:membrane protein [Asaia sp. SF2.1]
MLMRSRLPAITLYGSLACNAALLALGKARTGRAVRGVNCTAHWLKGDDAASYDEVDLIHSGTGAATNVAAVLFWAVLYDRALGKLPGLLRALLVTLALGPVSALVDYKATPKRFTPGWELVFSKRDMALVYAAMVTGMAFGATRRRKS